MIRREFNANFKNFIVWLVIILAIFLVVFLVYPSIASSDNIKMIDEMMEIFPEEMLKAFNMDISSIDTVFGWLKSEGFVFIVLLTGIYSALLASQILLKEENDKTIEYLAVLPVKRKDIVLSKVLVGIAYITLLVAMITVFNFIGLYISGDFDKSMFLMLSFTPLLSSYVIFGLCFFISTFTNKTKKMIGISLGIVFISYFMQLLSTLSSSVEFLKYFSLFSLTDTRNIILNSKMNPLLIFFSIFITVVLLIMSVVKYKRKELI